jgi:perosamine synthetase
MEEYGYKYKMSNLQAAMGCAQVERVDELVSRKREIFAWYKEFLKGDPLQLNPERQSTINSYWMPTAVFDDTESFNRESLFEFMRKHNIDTRPFFYPLSSLPMFESCLANTVSYSIFNRGVNLPSHHALIKSDIEYVCAVIKAYLKENDQHH